MKLVGLMILLPLLALFALASKRIFFPAMRSPEKPQASGAAVLPATQSADGLALQKIKREHASGRFPFLVSSLCRDFLERHADSPHRAEVESILSQTQQEIEDDKVNDPAPPPPPRNSSGDRS